MLYGLLVTLFVTLCATLVLLILIQKGKSSMGLGNLGGGTQLLFGGSGGQDLFQKITWFLGALFMGGSLVLAMMKKPSTSDLLGRLGTQQAPTVKIPAAPAKAVPATAAPAQPEKQAESSTQKPA
jgi:protein translocase SecG subunit